jgi:hypothetical protein
MNRRDKAPRSLNLDTRVSFTYWKPFDRIGSEYGLSAVMRKITVPLEIEPRTPSPVDVLIY